MIRVYVRYRQYVGEPCHDAGKMIKVEEPGETLLHCRRSFESLWEFRYIWQVHKTKHCRNTQCTDEWMTHKCARKFLMIFISHDTLNKFDYLSTSNLIKLIKNFVSPVINFSLLLHPTSTIFFTKLSDFCHCSWLSLFTSSTSISLLLVFNYVLRFTTYMLLRLTHVIVCFISYCEIDYTDFFLSCKAKCKCY